MHGTLHTSARPVSRQGTIVFDPRVPATPRVPLKCVRYYDAKIRFRSTKTLCRAGSGVAHSGGLCTLGLSLIPSQNQTVLCVPCKANTKLNHTNKLDSITWMCSVSWFMTNQDKKQKFGHVMMNPSNLWILLYSSPATVVCFPYRVSSFPQSRTCTSILEGNHQLASLKQTTSPWPAFHLDWQTNTLHHATCYKTTIAKIQSAERYSTGIL